MEARLADQAPRAPLKNKGCRNPETPNGLKRYQGKQTTTKDHRGKRAIFFPTTKARKKIFYFFIFFVVFGC